MSPKPRLATAAVLGGMAMVVLDSALVNVALPGMARSLGAEPASIMLVVSSYHAALLAGLLPAAHLAERFGARSLFIAGAALFSAASIVAAGAGSLPALVAARVLQGLGGSAVMALGVALLRSALGADRLGAAIGWNALTVALCSAAGPIAGAAIVSAAPWRWLFPAKLPVGLLTLSAATALPRSGGSQRRVDGASIALHAASAGFVVAAAQCAVERPFPAALAAAVAATCAILLVRRNRALRAPLVPLDLLTLRRFRFAAAASVCCFAGQSAGLVALPFHLQPALGRDAIAAGPILACWPLGAAAAAATANRLVLRVPEAVLCSAGATILAAGLLSTALAPAQGRVWPIALAAMLSGIGFGLFQVPNNRNMFLSAPAGRSAAAGGLQGTARLAGQTLGALMLSVLLACSPTPIAVRMALILASLSAGAAALVSARTIPSRSRPKCGSGPAKSCLPLQGDAR